MCELFTEVFRMRPIGHLCVSTGHPQESVPLEVQLLRNQVSYKGVPRMSSRGKAAPAAARGSSSKAVRSREVLADGALSDKVRG